MDPDLTFKDPTWNGNAIGWARHYRDDLNGRLGDKEATIRLLEARATAAGKRGGS